MNEFDIEVGDRVVDRFRLPKPGAPKIVGTVLDIDKLGMCRVEWDTPLPLSGYKTTEVRDIILAKWEEK